MGFEYMADVTMRQRWQRKGCPCLLCFQGIVQFHVSSYLRKVFINLRYRNDVFLPAA